jgi:hypothetical protein
MSVNEVVFGYQEADNVARVCLRSSGSAKIACGCYTKLDFKGNSVSLQSSFGGQRSISMTLSRSSLSRSSLGGLCTMGRSGKRLKPRKLKA